MGVISNPGTGKGPLDNPNRIIRTLNHFLEWAAFDFVGYRPAPGGKFGA